MIAPAPRRAPARFAPLAPLAASMLGLIATPTQALAGPVAARSAPPPVATAPAEGVLRVQSRFGFDETVTRLKADIAAKGIRFFDEIDQSKLGADAEIALPPSKLLLFGNPPLGVQFLTANRLAGLDWPVRMLVVQEADGSVWVAWTDFAFIARRYSLKDRQAAIAMATMVSGSIAASVGVER